MVSEWYYFVDVRIRKGKTIPRNPQMAGSLARFPATAKGKADAQMYAQYVVQKINGFQGALKR